MTDQSRERAEHEAAVWLVRLSDAPDDADLLRRFEEWRTESELNAEIWSRTARGYDLAGKAPPEHRERWQSFAATRDSDRTLPPARPVAAGETAGIPGKTHHAAGYSRLRLGMGLAAAGVAACLMVAILPDALLRAQSDLVTATDEVRSAVLEDGTRLDLSPESAVEFRFSAAGREVRLIQGSAYFDVAHDPDAPFRVVAGDTVTTVLGTAFEIGFRDDAESIAVQEGRVHVVGADELPALSAELVAGEWLRINAAGAADRGLIAPDDVAAWRNGELVARDRTVGDIVDALRRYHTGAIFLRDGDLAARRVSGIFDLRNPVESLRDLAASHGARVIEISPWIVIVTSG